MGSAARGPAMAEAPEPPQLLLPVPGADADSERKLQEAWGRAFGLLAEQADELGYENLLSPVMEADEALNVIAAILEVQRSTCTLILQERDGLLREREMLSVVREELAAGAGVSEGTIAALYAFEERQRLEGENTQLSREVDELSQRLALAEEERQELALARAGHEDQAQELGYGGDAARGLEHEVQRLRQRCRELEQERGGLEGEAERLHRMYIEQRDEAAQGRSRQEQHLNSMEALQADVALLQQQLEAVTAQAVAAAAAELQPRGGGGGGSSEDGGGGGGGGDGMLRLQELVKALQLQLAEARREWRFQLRRYHWVMDGGHRCGPSGGGGSSCRPGAPVPRRLGRYCTPGAAAAGHATGPAHQISPPACRRLRLLEEMEVLREQIDSWVERAEAQQYFTPYEQQRWLAELKRDVEEVYGSAMEMMHTEGWQAEAGVS